MALCHIKAKSLVNYHYGLIVMMLWLRISDWPPRFICIVHTTVLFFLFCSSIYIYIYIYIWMYIYIYICICRNVSLIIVVTWCIYEMKWCVNDVTDDDILVAWCKWPSPNIGKNAYMLRFPPIEHQYSSLSVAFVAAWLIKKKKKNTATSSTTNDNKRAKEEWV